MCGCGAAGRAGGAVGVHAGRCGPAHKPCLLGVCACQAWPGRQCSSAARARPSQPENGPQDRQPVKSHLRAKYGTSRAGSCSSMIWACSSGSHCRGSGSEVLGGWGRCGGSGSAECQGSTAQAGTRAGGAGRRGGATGGATRASLGLRCRRYPVRITTGRACPNTGAHSPTPHTPRAKPAALRAARRGIAGAAHPWSSDARRPLPSGPPLPTC